MAEPAIGIDLGTTFSCVAAYRNGRVEVLRGEDGNIMPSVVAFTDSGSLVGRLAKEQQPQNPENTIFKVKRIMGRMITDSEVTEYEWPFSILSDENGRACFNVSFKKEPKRMTPEEISGRILEKMKTVAEYEIGEPVRNAVITVPANFNDAQRRATQDAGKIAGLEVLRIINEPTAAAISYGFVKQWHEPKTLLVYDLGGGTFDVSVVRVDGYETPVLATKGIMNLGGEDFDERLYAKVANQLHQSGERFEKWKLLALCERAKRELSQTEKTAIRLMLKDGRMLETEVTRAQLEQACEDLIQRTIVCVSQTIEEAKLKKEDVDEVVLVGGSSSMLRVQAALRELFPGRRLNYDINPEEAIARGAALLAAKLQADISGDGSEPVNQEGEKFTVAVRDITPLPLGICVRGKTMSTIIDKHARIPANAMKNYTNEHDYAKKLRIQVFEGEDAETRHNRLLGEFLIAVEPAPAGQNDVDVTFHIDDNGVLEVSAVDKDTGESSSIVVERRGMTDEKVQQLAEAAENMRIADMKEEARRSALTHLREAILNSLQQNDNKELIALAERTQDWLEDNKDAPLEELEKRTQKLHDLLN